MHHWLTGKKKIRFSLLSKSLCAMTDSLILSLFKSKPNKPSNFSSRGLLSVLAVHPAGLTGGAVIGSCAGAPAVWRSWGKPVFCRAQSLVVGLEVVLKPLHRLSHPFVQFHWSPSGIPQVPGWWMCRQKHLFPRIPQGKTWQGFKTRDTENQRHIHSTKGFPYTAGSSTQIPMEKQF